MIGSGDTFEVMEISVGETRSPWLGSWRRTTRFSSFGDLRGYHTLEAGEGIFSFGTLLQPGELYVLGTLQAHGCIKVLATLSLSGDLLSSGTLFLHGGLVSFGALVSPRMARIP